ncbi:MAG: MATE family efflux transporter [Bacteroidales bacterium]|nr:MATE family efflux transporter [Bacteroidales bacterium]
MEALRYADMNRQVLKLAVPSIFANITVPLVGMVDVAIAGRLGEAALIGAVAVASMLFDLLYWNMGFLRVGTSGMVAQAYGRGDFSEAMSLFVQGIFTAMGITAIIWAVQFVYVDLAFKFIEASPQVEALAREYYFIRIWAAPATLSLYVFKGFFIGMQNAVRPMAVDVTINLTNLAASIFFSIYAGMGFKGIAVGTVVAQYTGLILSIVFMFTGYRNYFKLMDIKASMALGKIKKFFVLNSNLFLRSICFLFIYTGFTSLSAKYGDVLLAVCTIIMKLMMLFSYFIDGFAYAGEALSGRYIGARDRASLIKSIKVIFIWSMSIGVVSTVAYLVAGEPLVRMLTDNVQVIEASRPFLPWLLVMPIVSCAAFTWDGIFIGATASVAIRNSMAYAVIAFYICYFALDKSIGVQSLWVAYMAHLVVRTVYLSAKAKKDVLDF